MELHDVTFDVLVSTILWGKYPDLAKRSTKPWMCLFTTLEEDCRTVLPFAVAENMHKSEEWVIKVQYKILNNY